MAQLTQPDSTEAALAPIVLKGLLAPEEIRKWRRPNGWRVARDLSLIWVQVLAPLALFFWWPNWATFAIAFVLVAGGQHGLYLASHDFAHYSIIPHNRRLNDLIGIWLFAAPVIFPMKVFRYLHFAHHRLYTTDDDTKTIYRRDPRGLGVIVELLRCLSGWEFLYRVFEVRRRSELDAKQGATLPGPMEVYPPILVVQAVIFAAFSVFSPVWYFLLWLLPNFTLVSWFSKIRAMMEHRPLDPEKGEGESPYFGGADGPFVRTVKASWFERLFISKINFCYHAEHHLWPQLSYQHLPKAHERMIENDVFADERFGLEDTYLSTFRKLCHGRFRGMRKPQPTATVETTAVSGSGTDSP